MKERTSRLTDGFFARHEAFGAIKTEILGACGLLLDAFRRGGKLLACGNGGSCADADHIVGELMKGFLLRRPLPEAERAAFAEQFGGEGAASAAKLGRAARRLLCACGAHERLENDVIRRSSTRSRHTPTRGRGRVPGPASGNAENVRAAAMAANPGRKVIALTGEGGGKLAPLADCAVRAPERETYRVQECHLAIYHFLCAYVESELFDE
ncbi:MAG: SIS domain-containing protein [Anaerotruncus massiliensis (ex Togo et al. 2019)]